MLGGIQQMRYLRNSNIAHRSVPPMFGETLYGLVAWNYPLSLINTLAIVVLLILPCFQLLAVADAPPSFSSAQEQATVCADLARIDAAAVGGNYENASVIIGKSLEGRHIYRDYLAAADVISQNLLKLKTDLGQESGEISLQELGAKTQQVNADYAMLIKSLTHGETAFESFGLIRKAVTSLDDATRYWRLARRYRPVFRSGVVDKRDDDDILSLKIRTALEAIGSLDEIIKTRDALTKDLADD